MDSTENTSQPQREGSDEEVIKKIDEILQEMLGKISDGPRLTQSASVAVQAASHQGQQAHVQTVQSAPPRTGLNHEETLEEVLRKLLNYVSQLSRDGTKLKDLQADAKKELKKHLKALTSVKEALGKARINVNDDLQDITRRFFNLACQFPVLPDKRKKGAADSDNEDEYRGGRADAYLPGIHKNVEDLTQSEAYGEVIKIFEGLDLFQKMCLLSFAVFPENGVVNRTMLMYWWMAEGFIPVTQAEKKAKQILEDFEKKGLIEAVEDERKTVPASFKMPPLVHSTVIRLSMAAEFFQICDGDGKPAMIKSKKKKVCLVDGSSSWDEAKVTKMQPSDIETVFNVSERFPDFTFKWFKEMKALRVLYLGRWERTAKRHIEVESPELMKNLNLLSELRFLSLQGISRIERLDDDSVCKLRKLIILDLRACYSLEKLPEKIDSLKNLIYLDISECYMMDRMPKRLAWLENLEVLKGFVVSDAAEETTCRLIDLKHLKKLRKLSVTINKKDFDMAKLREALVEFKVLENLKVVWGEIGDREGKKAGSEARLGAMKSFFKRQLTRRHENGPASLSERLQKLDLQCFPDAQLPNWLQPRLLPALEKLYIKGGTELTGLGALPRTPSHCAVKVLRLKFLPKLQVEWRDLKGLYYPKLEFLEKYQCPRVTLCPCDGKGIWKARQAIANTD